MKNILLIGNGRLAQHLIYWNSLLKKPNNIIHWFRNKNEASPQSEKSRNELSSSISNVDIIWLAISDSQINDFYDKNLSSLAPPVVLAQNKPIVQFSGALNFPYLINIHPLMSFPTELMQASVYQQIHFVVGVPDDKLTSEINALTDFKLNSYMPGFENSLSLLSYEKKSFYHALCVASGNFPQLIWNEVFQEFKKLQLPNKALEVYIHQVTENFINSKGNALTGPLIRKDFSTLEKNLNSLKFSKLYNIYKTFCEVFTK